MPGLPLYDDRFPFRGPKQHKQHGPVRCCPPIQEWWPHAPWECKVRRGHIKKPHYALIWPKDKPKLSKWDRMKDCLQGKGPDMHVAIGTDKIDCVRNRQPREVWSNHRELLSNPRDELHVLKPKFEPNRRYDFYHRKYMKPHGQMCTDAIWHGPKNDPFPQKIRDGCGVWWEDVGLDRGRTVF